MTLQELVDLIARGGTALRQDGDTYVCDCPRHPGSQLVISQNGRGPATTCTDQPECAVADVVLAASQRATVAPTIAPLEERFDQLRLFLKADGTGGRRRRLTRVIRRGNGDAYDLEFDDSTIVALGNAATLYNQNRIRALLLPVTGRSIDRMKAAEWDAVVAGIDQVAEIQDAETDSDELLSWIAGYLRYDVHHIDIDDKAALFEFLDNLDEAAPGTIVTPQGKLCLRLQPLRKWITREGLGYITQPELGLRLSRLGFTKPDDGGQLVARQPGNAQEKRSGRYWISGENFDIPLPPRWRRATRVPDVPLSVEKSVPNTGGNIGDTGTPNRQAAIQGTTTGIAPGRERGHGGH